MQTSDASAPVAATWPGILEPEPPGPLLDPRALAEVTARIRAFDLIQHAQDPELEVLDEIRSLTVEADRRGWDEASVLARFALAVHTRFRAQPVPAYLLEELTWIAEGSSDVGIQALVAAYRSWVGGLESDDQDQDQALLADTQLASAVVLLERHEGAVLPRISAHTLCAIGFSKRDLWELEVAQYEAANAIDMLAEDPRLRIDPTLPVRSRWAHIYNHVEVEIRWALALRTVGDLDGQRARAQAALDRYEQALAARLPDAWLADLQASEILGKALRGDDEWDAAVEIASRPEARPELLGPALTAIALCMVESEPEAAREVAERAVEALGRRPEPISMELALHVAAEAEGSSAGLRLARDLTGKLWFARSVRLNAMEALLRSERFRIRSEELDRHAHLDPLTGLANRRGFKRYLDELLAANVDRVALLLVDIDRFKSVNDGYGHQAGDEALQRLGSVLRSLVRPGDLAARLGGDEFLMLLKGSGPHVAAERAASIMQVLAQSRRSGPGESAPFTVSLGVASGAPTAFDQLMADADRALYEGKATGGDRWVTATPGALRA